MKRYFFCNSFLNERMFRIDPIHVYGVVAFFTQKLTLLYYNFLNRIAR